MTKPALQAIDAETQIFTPPYVSKFLAQNSIGRLWVHSRPNSRLIDNMGHYVVSDNPTALARVDSPEEIRVLDPACGTGNLLVAAFDLLYDIYLDARYRPEVIPELILTKNLVGVDIDPDAAAAASAVLTAKAHERQSHFFRRRVKPNIRAFTTDDHPDAGLFGTLLRDLDRSKYHAILANPPYMGGKHFTPAMKAFGKEHYPNSKADLCAMFIERGHEMTVPGGMVAMITMHSWMFLSSFEALRRHLYETTTILTMAHLGDGVFGSGAVIATTAFVQASFPAPDHKSVFFRLVESKAKARDLHLGILRFRGSRPEMFDAHTRSEWLRETALLEPPPVPVRVTQGSLFEATP